MKTNLHSPLIKMLLLCFYLSIIVLSANYLKAQACNPVTDPNAYGSGSWIGHVYDHTGVGNPVTSPFATYKGYTTELEAFDRNWGTGKPDCANGNDNFAVRYRMNQTFAPGNYTFTIGGDDGVRLSIDGGNSWILSDWSDHGNRSVSVRVPMSGNYNMVLEYYEKGGDARVSFSYSKIITTDYSMPNANTMSIITACAGNLYDSGGFGGNYLDSENRSVIIKPSVVGNLVRVSSSITAEGGHDYLTIYDGEGTGGTILWGGSAHGSGTACTPFSVPTITSTTGSLTVRFYSDGSINCSGFNLAISCIAPVACVTPSSPTALNLTLAGTVVNGSFTPPATAPTGYVIARSTSNVIPNPGNGNNYTTGTTVAGYYIVRGTDTPSTVTTFTDTPGIGLFYYYVFSFNAGCTGAPFYSTGITNSLNTCKPTSTTNTRYIRNVQFVGTLNPDTTNSTTYSAGGYVDYTSLPNKAKQIQDGVINVNVTVGVTSGKNLSTVKAWIDWNKDGVFDTTEKIYDTSSIGVLAGNVVFGFVVPTTAVRNIYTIRIRVSTDGTAFGPCGNTSDGETEDYGFNVIDNCAAKITNVTAAQQCGPGPVTLTATGNGSTDGYEWFTNEFGNPIAGENSNTYTTISLPVGTYTYYVTAKNGTVCTSPLRTPIKITVRPTPAIVLTPTEPDICGAVTSLKLNSAGDKQQVTVLEDQFENTGANPLKFVNVIAGNPNANGVWQLRNTPFIPASPEYNILNPAISSGFNGGKFANIVTDVRQNTNILNHWVTINPLITTNVTGLKMDYDLYYFPEENDVTRNYLKVQYSLDGSTNWTDLITYSTNVGVPSRFSSQSINLPASCENITTLKIRFSLLAFGATNEWLANIGAIDNVRIYGEKDLPTNLLWSGDTGVIFPFTSCSGSLPSGGTPNVCIKLSDTDLKTKSQFTVTASALLSNGCYATGTIVINNNTKIWDATSSTDWNSSNWQPADSKIPPIANKCVIIRTPVILNTGAEGFAKNVKIEVGGKLTIKKDQSLTVTDAFIKDGAVPAGDVVIESDGNLIQVNEGININSGDLTAKRNVTLSAGRQQYNYLISPLEGQSLSSIYKDAAGNPVTVPSVLYHNEANNKFYNSSGSYIKGRGLAVKEPTAASFATGSMGATFTGKPTNGAFPYTILNSNTGDVNRGYNLIGNPYPSNIDLVKFYTLNGGATGNLSGTAYFWDSRANTKTTQEGDLYGGQSYGQLNMFNGTGTAGTGDIITVPTRIPTKWVKTGQAFMVKSKAASAVINFNNTIRTNLKGATDFFGKEAVKTEMPMNRYWLNMITPQTIASNIAVVYFADGNNGFAEDDSRTMGGSDVVYSIVENEKVSINGRSNFINTDIIPLGTQHFASGNYTLALGAKEGIFESAQSIYLKDTQIGTLTNLTEGNYTFAANAGESTGRFEIVYLPETVLATDGAVKENIAVYRDGNDFVVKAQNKKITNLEVYDTAGRLMLQLKPNVLKATIPAEQMINGVYILKIDQKGQITTKKIIR